MYDIAAYNELLARYKTGSLVTSIITYVVVAIGLYKMFQKAGIEEWTAFIPIVNAWQVTKLACGSGLYLLLILIPCVGPFIYAIFLTIINTFICFLYYLFLFEYPIVRAVLIKTFNTCF